SAVAGAGLGGQASAPGHHPSRGAPRPARGGEAAGQAWHQSEPTAQRQERRDPEMTPEQVNAACEAFSAKLDRAHKVGKACQWLTLSATAGLAASSFDHFLRGAEHGLWLTALFGLSTIGLV